MMIGAFIRNLWHNVGRWIRPIALLISSLIIANGAAVSIVIMQLIDLNRSVGVIEGTIGSLPEDKRNVLVRLEKIENTQGDLQTQLTILNTALGQSPKDLIIAAEKVKDNFAAFDQLRTNVSQMQNVMQDLTGQLATLQGILGSINDAMYDKEDGLITRVSDMRGDIGAIKSKLGIETP